MRHALHTAATRSPAYKKLHIHLSHNNENAGVTIARNILITHITSADSFIDPKNSIADLKYLWDIWCSF